jgi:NADPH:quinone reductase-like Zn-dependent oxidoreductase
MQAKHIVFTEPNVAVLQDFAFSMDNLAPTEVTIRNHYSLISAGTELACLAGIESWAPLPFIPGYCSVGEVLAVGAAVTHVQPGESTLLWQTRQPCARQPFGYPLACGH